MLITSQWFHNLWMGIIISSRRDACSTCVKPHTADIDISISWQLNSKTSAQLFLKVSWNKATSTGKSCIKMRGCVHQKKHQFWATPILGTPHILFYWLWININHHQTIYQTILTTLTIDWLCSIPHLRSPPKKNCVSLYLQVHHLGTRRRSKRMFQLATVDTNVATL